ncbi:hypothetical protein CC78DRAFT_248010 [Lojkania enalia]|uniref:Uncharacterized protein n=1 Tax=Lojkania enalia TaxID=147567 RepID=A0A9P4K8R0_9PLEO|nr:hypothetical protein CC78DRAFT_248010 [Didymosphaeria enalia]
MPLRVAGSATWERKQRPAQAFSLAFDKASWACRHAWGYTVWVGTTRAGNATIARPQSGCDDEKTEPSIRARLRKHPRLRSRWRPHWRHPTCALELPTSLHKRQFGRSGWSADWIEDGIFFLPAFVAVAGTCHPRQYQRLQPGGPGFPLIPGRAHRAPVQHDSRAHLGGEF